MKELTPGQIVKELDKYIIGQDEAKKMVAVALRSRYRRINVDEEIRNDIIPKNILMIGPTGVGKTEIARRLAALVSAPFIKVEATKFTEVGYVGRDVDSIIRDLMEESIRIVKEKKMKSAYKTAKSYARERILDILAPINSKKNNIKNPFDYFMNNNSSNNDKNTQLQVVGENDNDEELKRQQIAKQLDSGFLDNTFINIEIEDSSQSPIELVAGGNVEEINFNIQDVLGNIFPKKKKSKRVTVKEALNIFEQEEANKLIDMEEVNEEAKKLAEDEGIIFIDEMDKIAGGGNSHGPDVSREGVQRDILPIVEGSTVNTKYGPIKTDHMLFIAAGAFHVSKVTDLIPELQGRFPVHVKLENLTKDDFKKILQVPKNALIRQYTELLKVDKVNLEFTDDGIDAIAETAFNMNQQYENIGARRLHTVLEQVLMDVSYEAPDAISGNVIIDKDYVYSKVNTIYKARDINKYII